jgi:hypothetical protein
MTRLESLSRMHADVEASSGYTIAPRQFLRLVWRTEQRQPQAGTFLHDWHAAAEERCGKRISWRKFLKHLERMFQRIEPSAILSDRETDWLAFEEAKTRVLLHDSER